MSKQETIEDILREMREEWAVLYFSNGSQRRDGEYTTFPVLETEKFARRIKAAWNRERVAIEADALNAGALIEAFRRNDKEAQK